jgi:RNA polymerase sigma factor (TIGR02999 family)
MSNRLLRSLIAYTRRMAPTKSATELMVEISGGNRAAADELLPLVYDELRRLARARMARLRPGQTLQPTALVHEAYVRLVKDQDPGWANRAHFFAAAAEAMRRVLIDRARWASREKRGGGRMRVTLSDVGIGVHPRPTELLALDDALRRLEQLDQRMAAVVKLRFFAGLTQEETALAMGISRRTVNRLSAAARAWLAGELGPNRRI